LTCKILILADIADAPLVAQRSDDATWRFVVSIWLSVPSGITKIIITREDIDV